MLSSIFLAEEKLQPKGLTSLVVVNRHSLLTVRQILNITHSWE